MLICGLSLLLSEDERAADRRTRARATYVTSRRSAMFTFSAPASRSMLSIDTFRSALSIEPVGSMPARKIRRNEDDVVTVWRLTLSSIRYRATRL